MSGAKYKSVCLNCPNPHDQPTPTPLGAASLKNSHEPNNRGCVVMICEVKYLRIVKLCKLKPRLRSQATEHNRTVFNRLDELHTFFFQLLKLGVYPFSLKNNY